MRREFTRGMQLLLRRERDRFEGRRDGGNVKREESVLTTPGADLYGSVAINGQL